MLHDAAATAFILSLPFSVADRQEQDAVIPENPKDGLHRRTYETDRGHMTINQMITLGGEGSPGRETIRRRHNSGERRFSFLVEGVRDRKNRVGREAVQRNRAA